MHPARTLKKCYTYSRQAGEGYCRHVSFCCVACACATEPNAWVFTAASQIIGHSLCVEAANYAAKLICKLYFLNRGKLRIYTLALFQIGHAWSALVHWMLVQRVF
jgi:hypothetical protein